MTENTQRLRLDKAMYVTFKPNGTAGSLGFVERKTLFYNQAPGGTTLRSKIGDLCQPSGNLSRPAGYNIHILENVDTAIDNGSKYPCV